MRVKALLAGTVTVAGALTLVAATSSAPTLSAGHANDLATARAATASFHDVSIAESAGYGLPPEGPLHECIASFDEPAAMGLHYINGELVSDTVLDPARPEALVYAPTRNGGLRLVAVEYVVFAEAWDAEHPGTTPSMFGREMALVEAPNRYEIPSFYQIHAWLWKHNHSGIHADFNHRVTCSTGR